MWSNVSNRLAETDAQEFVSFFWTHMVTMIPETVNCSRYTEQFFNIALEVFRYADEFCQEQMPLASYLQTWSVLLLGHKHDEVRLHNRCSDATNAFSLLVVTVLTG